GLLDCLSTMSTSPRQSWFLPVVLVGGGYIVIGIVFAMPATHVQAWRLSAWAVSVLGYAGHLRHERVRLRNSLGSAALHVSLAVALGAFGLAVGANLHSLS